MTVSNRHAIDPEEVERVLAPLYARAKRPRWWKREEYAARQARIEAIDVLGAEALEAARRTGLPYPTCLRLLLRQRRLHAFRERTLYPAAIGFFLTVALSPVVLALFVCVALFLYDHHR